MPRDTDTSSTPTPAGDAAWYRAVSDADLSINERAVLFASIRWLNWQTGENLRPSQAVWARRAGLSKRLIFDVLASLVRRGVLRVVTPPTFTKPGVYVADFGAIVRLATPPEDVAGKGCRICNCGKPCNCGKSCNSGTNRNRELQDLQPGVAGSANEQNQGTESGTQSGVTTAKADRKAKPKASKASPEALPDGFARFWAAWPKHFRKKGRPKCLAAWKARGLESKADTIVACVEAWKRSHQWTKDGGEYIPGPLPFLNDESWDAEPPPPAAGTGSTATAGTNPAAADAHQATLRFIRGQSEAVLQEAERLLKAEEPKYAHVSLNQLKSAGIPAFVAKVRAVLKGVVNV